MDEPARPPLGDDRPLTGLRVIELASVLAGPLAGSFFAELGAEVTKVEHPGTGGDVTRQWRSAGESAGGPSAYYAAANGPKATVLLDLSDAADRAELDVLLASADVLLQNFKGASLDKLGLNSETLAKRFPRLIHVHLRGFLTDPDRAGYDMVVQAETGFMAMNGEPGRPPFRMPVAMMDVLAAHQMRSAALLAMWERERDGRGSYLEVWLDASGLGALVNRATEYLVAGQEPEALGALHPQIAPYGERFSCACGGSVVLAVGSDQQFRHLCGLLGHAAWADEAWFVSNPQRVVHRAALAERLAGAIAQFKRDDLLTAARESGVPMGRVNKVSEALEQPAGRAMTAAFTSEDKALRRVRQVAFRIHRNGNFKT